VRHYFGELVLVGVDMPDSLGGYRVPLGSGWVGAGGTGGGLGKNKGPLTPHPTRNMKATQTGILTTIDIICLITGI
jgi:hypothetical protein